MALTAIAHRSAPGGRADRAGCAPEATGSGGVRTLVPGAAAARRDPARHDRGAGHRSGNSASRRTCTCRNSASRAPRSKSMGTISMTGHMAAAPSIQDLQHAIQRGDLTLTSRRIGATYPDLAGAIASSGGARAAVRSAGFRACKLTGGGARKASRRPADAASAGKSVRITPHGAPPRGGFDARAL